MKSFAITSLLFPLGLALPIILVVDPDDLPLKGVSADHFPVSSRRSIFPVDDWSLGPIPGIQKRKDGYVTVNVNDLVNIGDDPAFICGYKGCKRDAEAEAEPLVVDLGNLLDIGPLGIGLQINEEEKREAEPHKDGYKTVHAGDLVDLGENPDDATICGFKGCKRAAEAEPLVVDLGDLLKIGPLGIGLQVNEEEKREADDGFKTVKVDDLVNPGEKFDPAYICGFKGCKRDAEAEAEPLIVLNVGDLIGGGLGIGPQTNEEEKREAEPVAEAEPAICDALTPSCQNNNFINDLPNLDEKRSETITFNPKDFPYTSVDPKTWIGLGPQVEKS